MLAGKGRHTFRDGSLFEGTWKDGERVKGKWVSANRREEYAGEWQQDMRHGEGSALVEGFYQYTGTSCQLGVGCQKVPGGTSCQQVVVTRLQVSGKVTTSMAKAKPAGSTARRMMAHGLEASGTPHSKGATVSSLSSFSCGQNNSEQLGVCAGLATASWSEWMDTSMTAAGRTMQRRERVRGGLEPLS